MEVASSMLSLIFVLRERDFLYLAFLKLLLFFLKSRLFLIRGFFFASVSFFSLLILFQTKVNN
jgi:hypothetical protein